MASKRPFPWKALLLLAVLALLFAAALRFDLGTRLVQLRGWIDSLGFWGPFAYAALYAVAVVAMVPGSAATVLAGALFGSVWGVVVVSAGSILGASLAFLIARYAARKSVAEWLSGREKFRKLDALTETHGSIMVALTRLVPLFPFNLLNYGFGLTKVPFRTYVGWSWLCMLPGTILYVVGADAVTKGLAQGRVPWALVAVAALAAAVLALVARHARRVVEEKEGKGEQKS